MPVQSNIRAPVRALAALTALAALGLAGCASVPTDPEERAIYNEINDPLEPLNRGIFGVNRALDFWILRPVAVTYRDVLPSPVKTGVRNFLDNLSSPVVAINMLLQGDTEGFNNTVGRFIGNSIAGIGGIFDVMTDIPKRDEDFGQTLAVWGSGEGPYLMLPVLGPSSLRDGTGRLGDLAVDPLTYLLSNGWSYARAGTNGVDLRARNIQTLDEIERNSLDYYATIRSLYRQRRNDEIRNGRPSAPQLTGG